MILIQEEKALDSCSMMNVCYLKIGTRLARICMHHWTILCKSSAFVRYVGNGLTCTKSDELHVHDCMCMHINMYITCSLSRSEYHTVIIFESSTRALEIDHVVRKKTS